MKLKRASDYKKLANGYNTQGHWLSADNRFKFRRTFLGWKLSVLFPGHHATEAQQAQTALDAQAVRMHGLDKAYFKTRRDAVTALDTVLATFEVKP